MSEYKEPMELDEAYNLADALYAAGYKDRHNERDYDPRKCPEWQAVVDPLIEQAAPEAAADWLNTILWMYRRLPQAYGRPPFIEQSIKTLAKQVGQDVTHELRERVVRTAVHEHGARQAAPAVPYRVAEFWSSATAGKKVRMLAEGNDIVEWAKRDDFIRWVDAPPVATPEAPAGSPARASVDLHEVLALCDALIHTSDERRLRTLASELRPKVEQAMLACTAPTMASTNAELERLYVRHKDWAARSGHAPMTWADFCADRLNDRLIRHAVERASDPSASSYGVATPEAPASEQQAAIYQVAVDTNGGIWKDVTAAEYNECAHRNRRVIGVDTAATTTSASEESPLGPRRWSKDPEMMESWSAPATAKPAYTRTDAMLAFSAMCDTSLITRPAAEAMRDTLCAAVETSAPETHPKAGASDA